MADIPRMPTLLLAPIPIRNLTLCERVRVLAAEYMMLGPVWVSMAMAGCVFSSIAELSN